MKNFVINNRYQIQKKLATVANSSLFMAYDSLTEQQVFLSLAFFDQLGKKQRDSLVSYYGELFLWLNSISLQSILPVIDFAELSVGRENQEILAEFSAKENLSGIACYFVSSWPQDSRLLIELSHTDAQWEALFLQSLKALSWLHDQGVGYHNISPYHTIVQYSGEEAKISFANIGIIPPGHLYFPTNAYSAPEIIKYGVSDIRSDLYSLAASFYHAITAEWPRTQAGESYLSQLRLGKIIDKCLEINPNQRYSDAVECLHVILLSEETMPMQQRRFLIQPPLIAGEQLKEVDRYLHQLQKGIFSSVGYFFHAGPGEGKTSALDYLKRRCIDYQIPILSMTCVPNQEFPLLPFVHVLEELDFSFSPQIKSSWKPPLQSDFSLEETYAHIRKHIAQILLAHAKPICVLFIDDLQWAAKELLDTIRYLMSIVVQEQRKHKQKFLIIGAGIRSPRFFPDFLAELEQDQSFSGKVIIQPINQEMEKNFPSIIANSLGMKQAPEKFSHRLAKVTNNNPLHLKKNLMTLLQKDILYKEHGEWCITVPNMEKLQLPSTLPKAINAYLSKQSTEIQKILDLLAVCGCALPIELFVDYFGDIKHSCIPLLWLLHRDGVIKVDHYFHFRMSSSTFWQQQTETSGYHDSDYTKLIHTLEKQQQITIQSFLLAEFCSSSQLSAQTSSYFFHIFSYLKELGLEESMEKYLEKYLLVLDKKSSNQVLYAAEMAYYLQRYTIAQSYFEICKTSEHILVVLVRLIEFDLQQGMMKAARKKILGFEKILAKTDNFGHILYNTIQSQYACQQNNCLDAVKYAKKVLLLSQSCFRVITNKSFVFSHYCQILFNPCLQNQFDSMVSLVQQALEMGQYLKNISVSIQLFHTLAQWYMNRGHYDKALENFQKSLELAQKLCYPLAKIEALLGITLCYIQLGCYKKASQILPQIVLSCKLEKNKRLRGKAYLLKAKLAFCKEKMQKAIVLYKEAIKICTKYGEKEKLVTALLELCDVKMSLQHEDISRYWKQAQDLLQKSCYPHLQIYSSIIKIKNSSEKIDQKQRIEELKKILKISLEGDYRQYLWQIYDHQAQLQQSIGGEKQAREYYKKAYEIIQVNANILTTEIKESYCNKPEVKNILQMFASLTGTLPLDNQSQSEFYKGMGQEINQAVLEYQKEASTVNLLQQREEIYNLQRLLEINKTLNREHNLQRLLGLIMDTAVEITKAERGFLILTSTQKQKAFEVARNFEHEDISHPEFEISHSITEKIIQTGLPILSTDAIQDERFDGYRSVSELRLHSVLAVPLCIRTKIIGALYIDNRFEKAVFSQKEKILLEAFADQAAIAIENARLFEENQKKQIELKKSKDYIEKLNQDLAAANSKLSQKINKSEAELKEVKFILNRSQYEMESRYHYQNIIGKSKRMQEIFGILAKIADKPIPIFIYGETGTGKELVARAIHFNSLRKDHNFLSENCAAFTETLLASELFGHVKGAFTGAYTDKKGLFELADGGTLFLDEVGDMSRGMQANLLRVLETNVVRRVGGKKEIPIQVRIISASNKNLKELVEHKEFREDLFFRLKVVQIDLPPLRERKEDIPLLVEHFLAEYAQKANLPMRQMDKKALSLLMEYRWPGNIRELRNVLNNAISLSDDKVLTAAHFSELVSTSISKSNNIFEQELSIEEYARQFVVHHQSQYNDSQIAKILGFSRKTLWEKRKKWGLPKE